jgi:hypothetical protein
VEEPGEIPDPVLVSAAVLSMPVAQILGLAHLHGAGLLPVADGSPVPDEGTK